MGMTASSGSFSADNWEASFVKTRQGQFGICNWWKDVMGERHTQAWGEQHDIQVGKKLL